jgi:hypothetical protein
MYTVYWIHKRLDYDFNKEGYVGITNNLNRRFREHKNYGNSFVLTSAIKKYGWDNLNKTILVEDIDLELAQLVEEMLRPHQKIGWNLAAGGGDPARGLLKGQDNSLYRGDVYATCIDTGNVTVLKGKADMIANGFLPRHIYSCLNGKRKTHNNHTYKRIEAKK